MIEQPTPLRVRVFATTLTGVEPPLIYTVPDGCQLDVDSLLSVTFLTDPSGSGTLFLVVAGLFVMSWIVNSPSPQPTILPDSVHAIAYQGEQVQLQQLGDLFRADIMVTGILTPWSSNPV